MLLFFAILAAVGCAVFNGIAAILEKIGAGQEKTVNTSHPGLLWRLRGNTPYLLGLILDLLAWILTLFAVHNLPLFLVQPIIACSVIVTLLVEIVLFRRKLKVNFLIPLVGILTGLVLLASVSITQQSTALMHNIRWAIILSPVVLSVIGSFLATIPKKRSAYGLATVSGLAFGGVSVAGRAIVFSHPYLRVLSSSLVFATIAYGLLGILFFTIALQRASAASVSATMIACETLVAVLIGLAFLGDRPKDSLWVIVILGIVTTLSGTIFIAIADK